MAATDVSDLLLRIDATTEGLRKELKKAEASVGGASTKMNKSVRSFDKRFASMATSVGKASLKVGKAVGLMSVAAVGALASIISSSVNTARELENLARVANTTPEQFQRMAYAAEQFGIEQTKLSDILKDMSDRVGDFLTTGGGPMADFFETIAPKVGVTAEQFKNLSGPDALQLYVASLEKANLTQNEMTFFMEAIASDSTMLLPLLKDNAAALGELGDEAERTGAVMKDETIVALREVDAELRKLKGGFTVVKSEIAAGALPAIKEFSETINSKEVKDGLEVFASALVRIGTVAATALSQVSSFAKGVGEFFASMVSGVDPGDKTAVEERVAELNRLIEYFSHNVGPSGVAQVDRLKEELKMLNGVLEFHNTVQPRASQAIEDTADAAAEATVEVDRLVRSTDQLSEVVVLATRVQGGLTVATEEVTAAVQETAAQADPMAKAWETAMERIDTAFADAWKGAFDSFSDFADGLKNAFKQLLAELAHMAITKPILVNIGLVAGSSGAMAGGGSSGAAGAASSALSGASLLTGLGGGIAAAGGNVVAGVTGFGSAIGLGPQTGAMVGSVAGLGNSALSAVGMSGASAGATFLTGAGIIALAGFAAYEVLGKLFGSNGNRMGGTALTLGDGTRQNYGKPGHETTKLAMQAGDAFLQFAEMIGGSNAMIGVSSGRNTGLELSKMIDDEWVKEQFDDIEDLMEEGFDWIIRGAKNLVPPVRELALAFEGTGEELAVYTASMMNLWNMAKQNPVEMASEQLQVAGKSAFETYWEQQSALRELASTFDGTLESTIALTNALGTTQAMSYQLTFIFEEVSRQVGTLFNGLRESIRTSLFSQEELYEYQRNQVHNLTDLLATLTDPEAILSTMQRIEQLTGTMWNSLDGDQRGALGQEFLNYLDETEALAEERLQRGVDVLERNANRNNQMVQEGIAAAAQDLASSAQSYMVSAAEMTQAVADFRAGVIELRGGGFSMAEVNV